jgi:heat shock protein HslJ
MVLPASKDYFMLKQPSRAQAARPRARNRVHAALGRRVASIRPSIPALSSVKSAVAVIMLAVALAGCTMPKHPDSAAPPTDPYNPAATQLLDDTQWDLATWTDTSGQVRAVPQASDAGGPVTLNLSTAGGVRKVNGFSGCNRYTGEYTLVSGKLSIGPLAGPRMACPPGSGPALEQPFLKALTSIQKTGVQMRPPQQLQLTLDNGDVMVFDQHGK